MASETMPSIYTPEQIRRFKEMGAIDPGTSYMPITGFEDTRPTKVFEDEETGRTPRRRWGWFRRR